MRIHSYLNIHVIETSQLEKKIQTRASAGKICIFTQRLLYSQTLYLQSQLLVQWFSIVYNKVSLQTSWSQVHAVPSISYSTVFNCFVKCKMVIMGIRRSLSAMFVATCLLLVVVFSSSFLTKTSLIWVSSSANQLLVSGHVLETIPVCVDPRPIRNKD